MAELTTFLTSGFRDVADHSIEGSIHFLCIDWQSIGEMLAAGHAVSDELKNLIVWGKDSGGKATSYPLPEHRNISGERGIGR